LDKLTFGVGEPLRFDLSHFAGRAHRGGAHARDKLEQEHVRLGYYAAVASA
jgi:hypothetical protein